MFKQLLDGHTTEYASLHPFHQEQARKYQSVVAQIATHFVNAETTIARTWLIAAHWDAVKKNEDWVETGWSAKPRMFYMFPREDIGTVSKPALLTIPSPSSTRTMVCLVSYKQVNRKGFSDFNSADFYECMMCDSAEEAETFAYEACQAVRFLLEDLPELVAHGDEVAEKKNGGVWTDKPDF